MDHATDQHRQNLQLAVTGCLSVGTGNNRFILEHVEPLSVAEQPSDAINAADLTLPANTAIRLVSDDERKLSAFVGQTVKITGVLRYDGHNTIGTSGRMPPDPNARESRDDFSMAGAAGLPYYEKVRREAGPIGMYSMANGTFPEMTVLSVEPTGKKCSTSPTVERR